MVILWMMFLLQTSSVDVRSLALGDLTTVMVVDSDRLDGEPWRMSWSPDAQQIYVAGMKVVKGERGLTHHVLDLRTNTIETVDAEPAWASTYWTWKSSKAAPGNPAFEIGLDTQKLNESATARPMGGALARGGVDTGASGVSVDEAAGLTSSNLLQIRMLLKGEVIGEWKGEPMVPGLTFGWAPQGYNAMAFADKSGRLTLIDEQGRKQRIDSTKDVRLPAWSDDGTRLAWMERQDRKKYRIRAAAVSRK
jgi:hypothetical protein